MHTWYIRSARVTYSTQIRKVVINFKFTSKYFYEIKLKNIFQITENS